jgi:hypothetical protein
MSQKNTSDDSLSGGPLPDAFLIELGRVSAMWTSLEQLLNICIGKLAGFDVTREPTAYIILVHSAFPQRLHMFAALCEQLLPHAPNLKNYKTVIAEIEAAQKKRNRFVHNGISHDPITGNYLLSEGSARGKLKLTLSLVTPLEINAVSKDIQKAMQSLYHLVLVTGPR